MAINTVVKTIKRRCMGIVFTLATSLCNPMYLQAETMHTEIIPMQYRPAGTLLRDLLPITEGQITITASGNKLIAKGTAGELAALKLIIEELDQPLAQFRIYIKRDNNRSSGRQTIHLGHSGKQIQAAPDRQNSSTTRDGIIVSSNNSRIVVHRNSQINDYQGHQHVRATEGYPAYIEIGKKVPVKTLLLHGTNHCPIVQQGYEPVVNGFYVTPRLANDSEVLLHLDTQKQSLSGKDQIDTERYSGTVRGSLNQWIKVGGISDSGSDSKSSYTRSYQSNLAREGAIYLKVERIQ